MTTPAGDELDELVDVGTRTLSVRRPRDAESLIDETAFGTDEFIPYWADLWPSGLALARHVAVLDLTGVCVLELGCGLGLPSLTAAARGAEVVATDWADAAIDLLRGNAVRNSLSLRAEEVSWAAADALAGETFELVLAADVLYEARNVAPLLALLDRTVAPAGAAIVADPGRRHAAEFFDRAARGWEIVFAPAPLLARGGIYELRRADG